MRFYRIKKAGCVLAVAGLLLHSQMVCMAAGVSALQETRESRAKVGQAFSFTGAGEIFSRASELLAERQEELRRQVVEEEKNLLAALIYCEAGGEPYEGQLAVGAVVMNRVGHESFPDSVEAVIYQSGQFGPAMTGKLDRVLAAGSATASCLQAAEEALSGCSPVGEALYFGDGQNRGVQIGGHWFHT